MAGLKENILAKSDGTTLKEHIEDCLLVFEKLREALPELPAVSGLSDFWELLFWAVFFHDFGKIHREFQRELRRQKNYWQNQRHEVYSVPFTQKLTLPAEKRQIIQRAILAHHKTFEELLDKYKSEEVLAEEWRLIWKEQDSYRKYLKGRTFHPEDFQQNLLYHFFPEDIRYMFAFAPKWYRLFVGKNNSFVWHEVNVRSLTHPVEEIAKPQLRISLKPKQKSYWQNLLLWGGLKMCDHYGSAKIKRIYILRSEHFDFLDVWRKKLRADGNDFYPHQLDCAKTTGHCVLMAPTGSGKTEAALAWLRRQLQEYVGRVFYVLPYTASINAMYIRLHKNFARREKDEELVGVVHGKLQQFLASLYDENEHASKPPEEINHMIRRLSDLQRKMVFPLKVTTPFQILKHFYGVKGFEMGITELAGSCLIFDEIHAYEPRTFAQITVVLEHLRQYLQSRILIMTATLPQFMLQYLKEALGNSAIVKADSQLLKLFIRHRVRLVEGSLPDGLELLKQVLANGKRVIVVCNTVQRAQEIFRTIAGWGIVQDTEMALLHSRFIANDRNTYEKRAQKSATRVLVGTQAIEVSLDIDYDVLFSEPAPLDALLQRFGRVNRRRQKGICDVWVFTEGGPYDQNIYPPPVVERTLNILKTIDVMDETRLQEILDFVYPDWEPEQKKEFEDTRTNFQQAIEHLQPFQMHKEEEASFYEQFDGVEVLPVKFLPQYEQYVQQADFIHAQRLMVTLHRRRFIALWHQGLIEKHPVAVPRSNGKYITDYILVARLKYDSALGLLNEEDAIPDTEDQML